MKKIMILHRSDLFTLTSALPIQELEAEHFKIRIADFNSASFIAFEEDGLLKILKNDRGACITLTCTSFLMAAQLVTSGRAFDPFPVDKTGNPAPMQEYFRPDYKDITPGSIMVSLDGDYKDILEGEISLVDKRTGEPIIPPLNYRFELPDKPDPKFIVGYDPVSKDQPDSVIGLYQKDPSNPNGPFIQVTRTKDNPGMLTPDQISLYNGRPKEFYKELMKTSEYYGHHLLQDYNDEMNSSVATAIELGRPATPQFPETLSEAIVFFDHNFHDIPAIAFQHTEIHFTTTFKMKYPEVYTNIKKSCGFWCEDSPLYKNLSTTYKCDHEACLLNIILKGIYRYRNAGRDRSDDFTDVINSYKP